MDTDYVEGLIASPHEMLGEIFDIKKFLDTQSKILNKFKKRMDPDLGFFYWTGAKEHYTELQLPSFNLPSHERLDSISLSRWGDPVVFVATKETVNCQSSVQQDPCGAASTTTGRWRMLYS